MIERYPSQLGARAIKVSLGAPPLTQRTWPSGRREGGTGQHPAVVSIQTPAVT